MKKGIYLVADPSIDREFLLNQIEKALQGGLVAVQLWNQWKGVANPLEVIQEVHQLTQKAKVPLYLNEGLNYLKYRCFDGIHLDAPTEQLMDFRRQRSDLRWGVTCSNNVEVLKWADDHSLDYVSYCSVFSSKTAISCDLVTPTTIAHTRNFYRGKVYLAGGITESTLPSILELPFDGIALVSAIMNAENPTLSVLTFSQLLNQSNNDKEFFI